MRYVLIVFCILFIGKCFGQTPSDPLNVLFVGNSLTYFNDMPLTFKAIVEDQGFYINVDHHTIGSAGFDDHLGNTELYQKFDNTVWDYVILQPGTSESLEISQTLDVTIDQGEQLRDKIFENSPCASIYLYETAYGITGSTPSEFQQFQSTQEIIKNNLIQISNQTGLPLAPVGESFLTSLQQNPLLFLWVNYGDIHPNDKGSFLAACTFYNALFHQPITDSSFNSTLPEVEANYLRGISELVTLDNLDVWNIDTLTANANFTFTSINETTANFTNTSTNFNTVLWDFGDGSTSSEINPIHPFDFSSQSSYQVYLTAFLGCKESHFNQTISQNNLSTIAINLVEDFSVYPNPVNQSLNLVSNSGDSFSYALFDLYGKIIHSEVTLVSNHVINTSLLSKGIYVVLITSNNAQKTIKIIKG